jgi:hypothetical protein
MKLLRIACCTVLALILSSCESGTTIVDPDPVEPDPSLVLTVHLEDAALAARMGWTAGVPGAQVWLQLEREPEVLAFVADSRGVVTVPTSRSAEYLLWAERRLSVAERQQLGQDTWVFGGGGKVVLPKTEPHTISLGAEDRGTLVFEEISGDSPPQQMTGGWHYDEHHYLRIRNNSDSVVFLDRKLLLVHMFFTFDTQPLPCSGWPFRNGPDHLYAGYGLRFPGSGTDHPVQPGQSVVIAGRAIRHDDIHPGINLPDLRGAHFELPHGGNPAVPNMIDVSPAAPLSWGARFIYVLGPSLMLYDDIDLGTVPLVTDPFGGRHMQLPRGPLLDAIHFIHPYLAYVAPTTLCPNLVDPSVDRLFGIHGLRSPEGYLHSISRRPIAEANRLQRTRNSMLDFGYGTRSIQ